MRVPGSAPRRTAAAWVLVGLSVCLTRPAAADALAELLDAVGADDHLIVWSGMTAPARDRAARALSRDELALLEKHHSARYSLRSLRAALEASLAREADPSRLAAAARRAAAPALARHQERVRWQQGPEGLRQQPRRMARVMLHGVERERAIQVLRIDQATGQSENLVALTASAAGSIAAGARALRCGGPAEIASARRAGSDEIRAASDALTSRVRHALNLAYWDAPVAEAGEAADAFEAEELRWLHGQLHDHLARALRWAERDLDRALREVAESRCDRAAP